MCVDPSEPSGAEQRGDLAGRRGISTSSVRRDKQHQWFTDALRERHTSALLMWNQGKCFLMAAKYVAEGKPRERGSFDHPAQFLACHGIELVLKSFLRAKGSRLAKLRREIGHSLIEALDRCIATGMEKPVPEIDRILEFAEAAHTSHEFRYGHVYHPLHIDVADLLRTGSWALESTAFAVAQSHGDNSAKVLPRMRTDAKALLAAPRRKLDPALIDRTARDAGSGIEIVGAHEAKA